ncbi:hypothetical protein BT96DRAFT_677046 [Gymnopus androsaceus JB14]|uniref:Uncharacterized protein n=1 Tax=Gymnopus androsaceus JB14 TaxID=1447944 RepID=A0A6A4HLX5_9AGAR|nr:hypothetical protein BT96DRAFT_677046 [Gymnopus androsaceus JB14]
MLRHGLLSPNSKLLPASASTSVDSLASLVTNGLTADRPGSTMSMISNASSIQTRSGLLKDTRDTSSRRLRHKDGRLLKGGIGLTTGLGWSDSEDEGAPSPLTRRLSTLNLSRKSSSVSLRSQRERSKSYGNLRPSNSMSSVSRPSTLSSSTRSSTFSYGSRSYNPLSRSYSSTLDTELDEVDEVNEFGEIHLNKDKEKGKNAPPPTSWSGKRSIGRIGIKSSGSSSSTLSLNTSVSKSGDKTPKTPGKSRIVRSSSEASIYSSASEAAGHTSRYGYGADEYATLTPSSTASSVSIPLPVTPRDGDDALITPTPSLIDEARFLNTNKGLPSLPNPITGSIRRPSAPPSLKKSNLRKRSMSSSSSGHPTGIPSKGSDTSHIPSVPSVPSSSSLMTMSMSSKSRTSPALSSSSSPQPPRQLQLPRQTVTNTNGQVPVPVPSFSGTRSRMRLPSTPSALPSHHAHPLPQPTTPLSPTDPTSTGVPRKSRVGTGMAYRSSPSTNSGMRLPSARTPVVGPKF